MTAAIDGARLIARLKGPDAISRDADGRLSRAAAIDAEPEGCGLLCRWLGEAGL